MPQFSPISPQAFDVHLITEEPRQSESIDDKAMAKDSDSSSVEVAGGLRRDGAFPVSRAKDPDNSLLTLLRRGMHLSRGQAEGDPHARVAGDLYEFLPLRSPAGRAVSDPMSPRALGELLDEALQVISATDDAVADLSPAPCRRSNDRGDGGRNRPASPGRGEPSLPKQ